MMRVEKAARRALAALAVPSARLITQREDFVVKSASACKALIVKRSVVTALVAQDLLESDGCGYRISAAGRAWLARQDYGGGDAFPAQHQVRTTRKDHDGASLTFNAAESPLAWLRSRKGIDGEPLLSAAQFEAGERLRADFEHGAMNPRVTANWSGIASDGKRGAPRDPSAFSDSVLAARQRYAQALDSVGPDLASVLQNVCCHLRGLEDVERKAGWPKRSGKVILQVALNALARHYGLIADPRQTPSRAKMRHWGADGFRPTIDGS
jgi:hypothetical protein